MRVNQVILNQIISEINLFELLDELNVPYKTEGKNIGVGWVGIETCPSCGKGNYHYALNIENKSGNCWACGKAPDLIGLIKNQKGVSYEDACNFLINKTNINLEEDVELAVKNIITEKSINKREINKVKHIEIPSNIKISSTLLKYNWALGNFIKKRGLDIYDCRHFLLRVVTSGPERGRLLIPIIFRKKVVAFQTRHLTKKIYKVTGNIKDYIFKYDSIKPNSNVLIVEGFFDYVRVYNFINKYKIKNTSVTTGFSKRLSLEQMELIQNRGPKKVIFMLDYDAWDNYYEQGNTMTVDYDSMIIPKDSDPGELKDKELLKIFSQQAYLFD